MLTHEQHIPLKIFKRALLLFYILAPQTLLNYNQKGIYVTYVSNKTFAFYSYEISILIP